MPDKDHRYRKKNLDRCAFQHQHIRKDCVQYRRHRLL